MPAQALPVEVYGSSVSLRSDMPDLSKVIVLFTVTLKNAGRQWKKQQALDCNVSNSKAAYRGPQSREIATLWLVIMEL